MAFWNKNDSEVEKSQVKAPAKAQGGSPSAAPKAGPAQEQRPQENRLSEPQILSGMSNPQPNRDLSPEEAMLERYGKLRSALGPGTVIQGKLSFDTPVRIDGKLGGEIFSSKALIVGPQGVIDAKVEVAALIVMGRVTGTIRASERIEVMAGAKISGDISTPSLVIQEGAVLNVDCKMPTASRAAERSIEHVAKAVSDLGTAIAAKTEEVGAAASSQTPAEEELRLH